jgi:hypothetical protein
MGVAAVTTAMALFGTTRYTAQGQDAGKPIPVKAMAKEADPDWEVDPNGWMDQQNGGPAVATWKHSRMRPWRIWH